MRVLAVTKIFPNRLEPLSSPFNRQQFERLKDLVDLKVLEAIPYVPFAETTGFPARAKKLAALPTSDNLHGIDTRYLRQLYAPKAAALNLGLYAASLAPYLRLGKWADVILGTWAYPDGCAAVLLGALVKRPVVVKVHGSDLNIVAKMRTARPLMRAVLPRASALVSVSRALSSELEGLGVPKDHIHLVPNGVDKALFFERDREAVKAKKELVREGKNAARWIVFCGRLEAAKGFVELLTAAKRILESRNDVAFAFLGDGALKKEADALAERHPDRVRVPGAVPLSEVAEWHGASSLFCLPSYNEGTPNVVLEALASGRPVVATNVGGIPDVVRDGENGFLVPPRDAEALERALIRAIDREWNSKAVAATGPISWQESASALYDVLERARVSGR